MRVFYFSCALVLSLTVSAVGQQLPDGGGDTRAYLIFLNGAPIGREDVTIQRDLQGVTIVTQARLGIPANVTTRRGEIRYRTDWTPERLTIDANINGTDLNLRTTFANGMAVSEGTSGSQPIAATDMIAPGTFVLPNVIFASHEALGRRLAAAASNDELHAFVAPGLYIPFRIVSSTSDQIQTGTSTFPVRRYELRFGTGDNPLVMNLTTTAELMHYAFSNKLVI